MPISPLQLSVPSSIYMVNVQYYHHHSLVQGDWPNSTRLTQVGPINFFPKIVSSPGSQREFEISLFPKAKDIWNKFHNLSAATLNAIGRKASLEREREGNSLWSGGESRQNPGALFPRPICSLEFPRLGSSAPSWVLLAVKEHVGLG